MLRMINSHVTTTVTITARFIHYSATRTARAPVSLLQLQSLTTPSDHAAARTWIEGFTIDDIPKDALSVSYSRSSGPGGQHVNKTNSKATVRCEIAGSGAWLPGFVIAPLRSSPHYLSSGPALQVSSQTTRSAGNNLEHATRGLHETIVKAARSVIIGETSETQKAKVRGLARAEEGRRRDMKDKRSSKKASRRDW